MKNQIVTERLILKPVIDDPEHFAIYQQILSSDDLTKYLPKGQAYSQDEIHHHFHNRVRHWDNHGYGSYVVFTKDKASLAIGYVGVEGCPNAEYSDIRYAMLNEEQGKGYVYEASKAVLTETFAKFYQLAWLDKKIYGVSLPENLASVHLLKKLGMQTDDGQPYDEDFELVVMAVMRASD